jgi:hypothetical protein
LAPLQRLDERRHARASLEEQLASHRAEHDHQVGQWLAGGCVGERPQPPAECVGLAQKLAELEMDAAAIETVYAEHQGRAAAASGRVVAATTERDVCLMQAVPEACEEALAIVRHQWRLALAAEAPIRGLIDTLIAQQSNAATQAAITLREQLAAIRREIEVPRDTGAGERLLERLVTDATACL